MGELNNALETSAKGITRELVKLFGGDREAAAQAVEELSAQPEALQGWATRMLRLQAKQRLDDEYPFYRQIVEANLERDEDKRVEHLTYEWLSAWLGRETRAIDEIEPFSFDEVSQNMKSTAARGMAMAYLTYTMTHQDSEVS